MPGLSASDLLPLFDPVEGQYVDSSNPDSSISTNICRAVLLDQVTHLLEKAEAGSMIPFLIAKFFISCFHLTTGIPDSIRPNA